MIICYIDNKKVFPNTTDKIKVTFENQFIKDSGSYTYEISFPMSIQANKEFFNNINRFDVKKQMQSFENCALLVDNRLIISGKGHLTSVTANAVKLQIAGGKSRIKYNSTFEKHFIDEISFPAVKITKGINHQLYSKIGVDEIITDDTTQFQFIAVDLTDYYFVGQPGVAAFNLIHDETNNYMSNQILGIRFDKVNILGHRMSNLEQMPYMTNLAVQPNFMYVLKYVLEREGYKLTRNDFDCDPWNRLLIASAHRGCKIEGALPHWSVYKFIDEVRKLFNASFIFDEVTKTVQILAMNELTSNHTVSYECDDDYSSEFDEDGFENVATSNLEYSFDDSINRDWREVLPLDVLRRYPIKEYASVQARNEALEKLSKKEKNTTIFKVGNDYFIFAKFGEDSAEQLTSCGVFAPLVRDIKSNSSVQLNIVPAAMYQRKRWIDGEGMKFLKFLDPMPNVPVVVPSISNNKEVSIDSMTKDDDDDSYYYSVQDAIENGTSDEKSEEADDKMVVMFQKNVVRNLEGSGYIEYTDRKFREKKGDRIPVTDVGDDLFQLGARVRKSPLSLSALPHEAINVDSKNKLCIKFYTDEIPDPSKIYNFRNKLFICEKVELEIDANGISKQKTGYFYEFL